MRASSISFIKPEEIKAMPVVNMVATHLQFNKDNIVRHGYEAQVLIADEELMFKIPNFSGDEFALLHYRQKNKKRQSQFSCPCRVRIVETTWPEKEGRKARSTYMIQIYVDKELKWEFGITGTIFLKAFLEALEGGDLGPQFKPVENIPYANEIEPKENDLQEANPGEAPAPQDPGEPLPF